jgi:hypothetical protein
VVEVGRVNGVRVQLETAEVDHPGQLRRVTQDDLVGRAPGRVAQLGRLDPAGPVGRRALLKKRLAVDAVDVALHRHRPAPGPAQRAVGHGQVVAHDVELRVAGLREIDLVGAGDAHLAPGRLDDLLARAHGRTLRQRYDSSPVERLPEHSPELH